MPAATVPAAIPAEVKPNVPRTTGTTTTAPTAQGQHNSIGRFVVYDDVVICQATLK
jgi:hypothetical protein